MQACTVKHIPNNIQCGRKKTEHIFYIKKSFNLCKNSINKNNEIFTKMKQLKTIETYQLKNRNSKKKILIRFLHSCKKKVLMIYFLLHLKLGSNQKRILTETLKSILGFHQRCIFKTINRLNCQYNVIRIKWLLYERVGA